MAKESTLRKNVAALIRERGGWARSVPQGIHSAGMADVVGCYRCYCLVLETKLPGREDTLTSLQQATLEAAGKAGAVARMITRKQQVSALLDAIDKKLDSR